jgi:hypothetical protein
MLRLLQGGVGGADDDDFHPTVAADQPFRMWKKGSASVAASKNYRKIRASLFCQSEGDHKKIEARQPPRAKWA